MRSISSAFSYLDHQVFIPPHLPETCYSNLLYEPEEEFLKTIQATAKIELHVHAEAAVSPFFYTQLNATKNLYSEANMPSQRAPFSHFRDFIKAWVDNSKLIESEVLVETLVLEFARDREKQGILYSEVHVSPSDFSYLRARFLPDSTPLNFEKLLYSYARGAQKAALIFPKIFFRFIVDVVWLAEEQDFGIVLNAFHKVLASHDAFDARVSVTNSQEACFFVAVGLGGPENTMRAPAISSHFESFRALGLKIDIHTGETTAAEDMFHSIQHIAPNRVSHGIACAAEDKWISQHSSFCLVSNLVSGAWSRNALQHPIKKAWQRVESLGLTASEMVKQNGSFSISSDDPLLMNTSLAFEYLMCFRVFNFSDKFFKFTQSMAAAAAFHPGTAHFAISQGL